jgi:ATP-dependent DNA helicase RecG
MRSDGGPRSTAASMTPDQLLERIARWEDLHTEFKRSATDANELAKDVACFANTDGGQLVIGVAESREIVGVKDVDGLLLRVDDVAYQRCRPPVTIVPEVLDIGGRRVVIVNVPKGDQRPYATASGQYYVRSGSRCRQASREELLRLFQAARSLFYDEQPIPTLTLGDLDLDAVQRYLTSTEREELSDDVPRLLRAWGLYDGNSPTVGGLVLFGRQPQDALESAKVVVAAFAGTDTGDDLRDRKDIGGGLFEIIGQVETFLNLHLPTAHQIRGFEPERVPEVPSEALRESLVNALVHRDYTIPAPVRVFVLADRVEVHTPGRPPNTVDAEAMRAGVHVPRNPHIYSRVADAALATRAGTGIRRIARLLRETGNRTLGITISTAEVVLVLPRLHANGEA